MSVKVRHVYLFKKQFNAKFPYLLCVAPVFLPVLEHADMDKARSTVKQYFKVYLLLLPCLYQVNWYCPAAKTDSDVMFVYKVIRDF